MWPDRVSNLGPLTYESGALPRQLVLSLLFAANIMHLVSLTAQLFRLIWTDRQITY